MIRGVEFSIVAVALAAMFADACHASSIVKFGPTLCPAGQVMSSGACIPVSRGKCASGYYQTLVDQASFDGPQSDGQCRYGYSTELVPDFFIVMYDGVLVRFGPTELCGIDRQYENGTCAPKVQARCPDNFYRTNIPNNSFVTPTVTEHQCRDPYGEYNLIDDRMQAFYNGLLVTFGATLCGNGSMFIDGACRARVRGTCPSGFYDASVSDDTLVKNVMGACESGYGAFALGDSCSDESQGPLCAMLCDAGLRYTGVGTCASVCNAGARRLSISRGQEIPLYGIAQTTPALGVSVPGGMCYLNLLNGVGTSTLNIKTNDGKVLHVVD